LETDPPAARVRIVMRTHDRPTLLARALDDLLAQSYRGWDLIVLNHRGDRAALDAVLQDRAQGFPHHWAVVDTDHPIGRDAIIGLGLDDSNAEYIAIHDDDDTWAADFLRSTVAWLDQHPDQVAVAVPTDIVKERIDEDGIVVLDQQSIRPPFGRISLFDLILAAHIPPIGLLYRRAAIEAIGGFDDSLSVLGDWDVMLRLAGSGPIGYLEGETLAFWRQRPLSEGALANSVIGDLDLHRQTDRELRDRALREYVERNGIGGLLFVARYVDEQFAASRHDSWARAREIESHLSTRIDEQSAQMEARIIRYIEHYAVIPSLRRAARRIFPFGRRPRGAQPAE